MFLAFLRYVYKQTIRLPDVCVSYERPAKLSFPAATGPTEIILCYTASW